jgi:S-adenosylmethionine:tRNA ribosyltransferase-isomerase
MRRSEFHYDLPADRIAQAPLPERGASRLLVLDRDAAAPVDRKFSELPELLRAGDLLVFNDTRVMPARLFGEKETGGAVEILVERVVDAHRIVAQCRASKPLRPGGRLRVAPGFDAHVNARYDDLFEIAFDEAVAVVLEKGGHMPLPPYIARTDTEADRERYQTIFARETGAVAAPTAGLHFDAAMLDRLSMRGVDTAFVTLHVGAGTFQPVRVEDIAAHRMHAERVRVDAATAQRVNAARKEGRRIVAVGTTVVRALESAASADGVVTPFEGETTIFIVPGYRFRVVDALLTNFHMSESTLLMLVCAFAGRRRVLSAYEHAIAAGYRFLSYGDAMFVTRNDHSDGI